MEDEPLMIMLIDRITDLTDQVTRLSEALEKLCNAKNAETD